MDLDVLCPLARRGDGIRPSHGQAVPARLPLGRTAQARQPRGHDLRARTRALGRGQGRQRLIENAARYLRHHATQSQYADLQRQEVAVRLVVILDELSRHLPDLNDGVRWRTI